MRTRREFLKRAAAAAGVMLTASREGRSDAMPRAKETRDAECVLFRAVNGHPARNMARVLELMGGVGRLIGPDEVVLIKPNVQWWNQGAPNLAALKAFVDAVMNRPGGFHGEVVLAENCHRGPEPWKTAGWSTPFDRNAGLEGARNMNGLCALLKRHYGARFSKCHWVDVDEGGRRAAGPAEGEGYVYCDGSGGTPLLTIDNGARGTARRTTIMTYPVFRTDRGTVIDFRNGVWEKGSYTGAPVFFVNFAALNHHSLYCGATSAVKNYMGVTDLSGGPDPRNGGRLDRDYCNFHSFPFDQWAPGPAAGMLGAEIGAFMNTVRRADLNITTAEWVGLSSRVAAPVAQTRAVLACRDPVALDYHAAKYVLHPNSRASIHDPDRPESPLRQYLAACGQAGGGLLDESRVAVTSWDVRAARLQRDSELGVAGSRHWGRDARAILKYLYLRVYAG